MGTYKKKELLNIISLLEKVNNGSMNSSNSNIPVSVEVLTECQEAAIAVGNALETFGEAGGNIVRSLEEYCENIYQMSLVINDYDQRRKLAKKIRKQLCVIRSRIKYDLPKDKKEIVFLPYKASMWDSLESVWKAAAEDTGCEVYVIPIPYFDKNPDGTPGQMHYEGNEYPADVPVTDWQTYDIAVRRPDIIYIHNPYDEFNHVTSVHPKFYAKELKKHTDMLVYIPYFVAISDRVQKHFCILPGTMYAHRVIVQSEAVRQTYIAQFRQFEKESDCRNFFGRAEEKFMALGSPKYDQVSAGEKEILQIPMEWEKLIRKPDGNRKKVILYNTTVDGMLKQTERMLIKIKAVLQIFQKEKDAVLLWRPHPLLMPTLEAMRPQLAEEYRNIVENYKKDGFGIFDDSADVHRAIEISDAYFGDMSSVVELYEQTGKPALIESCFISENKGLMFEAYVQVDEFTAYASSFMFNGLFKIDVNTGRCTYISMFPEEKANGKRLHAQAVCVNGKIYFAPASAENISVYDVENEKFEVFSIHDYKGEYKFYRPFFKFTDAVAHGSFIFFVPSTYPAVLRMRCETGEIDYYTDWMPEERMIFRKGTLVKENAFYIPNTVDNAVLEFHMDSCKGSLHHIGTCNHGSWSICEAGNDYWLIPRNEGALIRWNPLDNKVKEYNNYPEGFEGNHFLFSRGYYCNGLVRLIPVYANMSVKISPDTGEMTENDFVKVEKGEAIGFLFESKSCYYLFKQRTIEGTSEVEYIACYKLNILDNTLEECNFKFEEGKIKFADDYYKCIYKQKEGKRISKENVFFDIEDFLRNVIAENSCESSLLNRICKRENMAVGETIHKEIWNCC